MSVNLNPEEIDVDIMPIRSNAIPSQADQEARKQEYIVEESTDLLNFASFRGDPINFIIDGDNTLIIKEYKSLKNVADKHLIKLQNLYTKIGTLNNIQKVPSKSIWKKATTCLSSSINSLKCKPKYLLIKKVVVNLNQCSEVGDKGVKALADFIKNFENVEHLEFEVNNTSATDESLAFISSLLGSLKHITYFYIDFSGCRISDEGLFIMSSVLKNKTDLKELWLRFSWCTLNRITNEGIISVSRAVEYCKKLNVLLMEFNGHYDITSKGLSSVFSAAENLKSLRKLYTYFERAQATDNFLTYSGEVLQKLRKLRVFGLNLAGSNYLTPKGFEKIEKALFSLSGLREGLYMYFTGCLGPLDQDKMKRLLSALAKKRGIKNYVLEF